MNRSGAARHERATERTPGDYDSSQRRGKKLNATCREIALHVARLAKYVAGHEIATMWMAVGAAGHRWSAYT
jgi:hypothetical protein